MYPNERSEWEHICLCLLRFEFCKNPVGRTYHFWWYISAHFVKAVKGKNACDGLPKSENAVKRVREHKERPTGVVAD